MVVHINRKNRPLFLPSISLKDERSAPFYLDALPKTEAGRKTTKKQRFLQGLYSFTPKTRQNRIQEVCTNVSSKSKAKTV